MHCCASCFTNKYIVDYIKDFEQVGNCDYCKSEEVFVISIESFGEYLRESLSKGYSSTLTSDIPYHVLTRYFQPYSITELLGEIECIFSELIYNNGDYEKLLAEAFSSSGPTDRDIMQGEFDEWDNGYADIVLIDQFYALDNNVFNLTWEEFKQTVKHENRFFDLDSSRSRKNMLSVFDDFFKNMQVVLPVDTCIFRARINPDGPFEDTNQQIFATGPPPVEYTIPYRMNPAGISYFYGAEDKNTCLEETNWNEGEDVLISQFTTKRELTLIDLSNVPRLDPISIFSPNYQHEMNWARDFLESFINEISKPIKDSEASLEYIPTQILSEYIRLKGFQGIKYRSSITKNYNYLLFCGRIPENSLDIYPYESSMNDFRDWLSLKTYEYKE